LAAANFQSPFPSRIEKPNEFSARLHITITI
jgi:hypothetical protein